MTKAYLIQVQYGFLQGNIVLHPTVPVSKHVHAHTHQEECTYTKDQQESIKQCLDHKDD